MAVADEAVIRYRGLFHGDQGPRGERRALALLSGDRALELLLVHLRASVDAQLACLVVELVARAPSWTAATRALAAPPAGRDVARRGPRSLARLAGASALLVDGARRDLLRPTLGRSLPALRPLDVLVLAGPFGALLDSAWWHATPFFACLQAIPGVCGQNRGGPAYA